MEEESRNNVAIPTLSHEDLKPKFPYLDTVIRWSKVINMWPNTTENQSFSYYLVLSFNVFIFILLSTSCGVQLIKEYRNLDIVGFLADILVPPVVLTFRYIYVYIRGDGYLHLVSQIHNNFIHFSLFSKEDGSSMMKYYKLANALVTVYGISALVLVLQLITSPIIDYFLKVFSWNPFPLDLNNTQAEPVEYPVAFKLYSPFDYYKQLGNVIFYAFRSFSTVLVSWTYVVADCFWYMVFALTIGQFALLKDSIKTISETLKEDEIQEECQLLTEPEIQEVEKALKHCIRHHQFLREFLHLVDDLDTPNMLLDILQVVIVMCFLLLKARKAVNAGDWTQVEHWLKDLVSTLMHIFSYCWLGNEITVKEEELAEAIHEIQWYRCPKIKPLLSIMSVQARNPNKLTGGKLYTLSLDFFAFVMKAAFFYFTFVSSL